MAKILVAHDGSAGSDVALEQAAATAGATGASIILVNVVPVSMSGRAGALDPTSTVAEHAAQLDAALAKLRALGIEARSIEAVGHAADVICQVAQDEGANLIVVGSRGANAVQRFVMGSVSSRVAQHAHCSVLVAR